jgi:hypothetical protein
MSWLMTTQWSSHDPMSFLKNATEAGHPKDSRRHVDQSLHEVIMDNFHRPPHLLAPKRIGFLKKYTLRLQSR